MSPLLHSLFSFGLLVVSALGASATSAEAEADAGTTLYLLAPFDEITVAVYGQEDLSSRQRISDEGAVSIPLIGDVRIAGLSVSQAQKKVEQRLLEGRLLVAPTVRINIETFAPKTITVLGEVGKPGSIGIPPGRNDLPIQFVVAQAGGFTGAAQKNEVRVTRLSNPEDPASKVTLTVDVHALLRTAGGEATDSDFFVRADDIVFVPRRLF